MCISPTLWPDGSGSLLICTRWCCFSCKDWNSCISCLPSSFFCFVVWDFIIYWPIQMFSLYNNKGPKYHHFYAFKLMGLILKSLPKHIRQTLYLCSYNLRRCINIVRNSLKPSLWIHPKSNKHTNSDKKTAMKRFNQEVDLKLHKTLSFKSDDTTLLFQLLLYLFCLVLPLSLNDRRSLVCTLLCLFQTQVKHFSQHLDDLNFLTWINWCQLNFPNFLHHFFLILATVLLIFWNKNRGQEMSLLPIFLDPLILICELQRSVLSAINRVNLVGKNALSSGKWFFGLQ